MGESEQGYAGAGNRLNFLSGDLDLDGIGANGQVRTLMLMAKAYRLQRRV